MINYKFISKLKLQPKLGTTPPPSTPPTPDELSMWDAFTTAVAGAKDAMLQLTSASSLQVTGAGRLINISQTLLRSYTDLAKQQLWLEKRNDELNKTFGLTVKQAASYGQTLDKLSIRFKKGGDELRKYAINLQTVIGNYQLKDDAFSEQLLRTQEIITDSLGLSAEQAANFEMFARGANSTGTEYLVTTNAIAKELEGITGEAGLFKQITGDIADLSADVQLQYSRLPGTLEVATVKANRLGLTVTQLSKTGKQLLNIESSIGDELEYQLLSGRRLVNQQGKSLTNEFRVAQMRGDASKQADLMNQILDQEGETLENNLFAREQMSKLLGVDEATLARSLQKKKILEKIGGEALFNLSGKELFEAAKGLGASAEDLATLSEQEDTRSTESILASIERKLVTDGIRVNIPDQAGVITQLSTEILGASEKLAKLSSIGGPNVAKVVGGIEMAATVASRVMDFGTTLVSAFQAGGWAAVGASIASGARWMIGSGNAPMVIDETNANIQQRATGGPVVANTPYVVGEVGPELFVPETNGTIVPNNQMTTTNTTTGMDVTAFANALVTALQTAKFVVVPDPTFSGGGMNNPRYSS